MSRNFDFSQTPNIGITVLPDTTVLPAPADLLTVKTVANGEVFLGFASPAQSTGAVATISDTPPVAAPGALWWDSTGTGLYVRYNDGNSTQWVATDSEAAIGTVKISDTPPTAPDNALWWDSSGTGLYVRYNDGNSTQWVATQNPYTLTDAPNDANVYARHAGNWVNLATSTSMPFLPLTGGTLTGPVYYTATGGTVARSAQDRAAEVFNVRDHGVKMDGVTDDAAALQAVVDLAGPGATIYFPPSKSVLLLSRGFASYSNQTLWAYPGTVTIAPSTGNTATVLLWGTANTSNVYIHGLTFDGGGKDFATADVVTQVYRVNGLTLNQVTFQNTRGIAFNASGVNDLIIRGCQFVNCGNHWMTSGNDLDALAGLSHSSGDDVSWGFRMLVEGCRFSDCGGMSLGNIENIRIVGNDFLETVHPYLTESWGAYFAAVFAQRCTDLVIANNVMDGLSGNAIDVAGQWGGVISGNVIRNSGEAGIGLFDTVSYPDTGPLRNGRDIAVTGNLIENNGQWSASSLRSGVEIYNCASVRISNNVITDTQTSKTQQYGVEYISGTIPVGVWIDPSNYLDGNAAGPVNGVPIGGPVYNSQIWPIEALARDSAIAAISNPRINSVMAVPPVISVASAWGATTTYPPGSVVGQAWDGPPAHVDFWHTTTGGTSATTPPNGTGSFTDGTVTWTYMSSHASAQYHNPAANTYDWGSGAGRAGINGVVNFLGGIVVNETSTNCANVTGPTVNGTIQRASARFEFMTDSAFPIVRGFFFDVNQPMRLIVDDHYASMTPFSDTIGGWVWILIDLSTQPAAPKGTLRRITLESSGLFLFGDIDVAATEGVYKPHASRSVTLIVTGDSIAATAGADIEWNGFGLVLSDLLGCGQVAGLGIGGTGYLVNTGGGAAPPTGSGTAISRISDVTRTVAAFPNCIVLDENGLNDVAGFTPAQIQTACVQYLTQLRATIGPDVPIIKTGIWPSNEGGVAWTAAVAVENALAAAVTSLNDPLVFFMPLLGAVGGSLITGTGTSTAPNGTGNSDFYVNGTTLPHPTTGGHLLYASHLAALVRHQMIHGKGL